MYTASGTRDNPLTQAPALQVAFLFTKINTFVNAAESSRQKKDFENFSYNYQRAFSLIESLLGWLNAQNTSDVSSSQSQHSWDKYFLQLVQALNRLVIEYSQDLHLLVDKNLSQMAQTWRDQYFTQHAMPIHMLSLDEQAFDPISFHC